VTLSAPSHAECAGFVRESALGALQLPDVMAWRALQAASARRSPLTSYEFAKLADAAHGDVRVVLAGREDAVEFVLPFHARGNRFARPLGGAFSDVHGALAAEGFTPDLADILRSAGVSAYRFTGLDDAGPIFAPFHAGSDTSLAIHLEGSPEHFIAERRRDNVKRVKNYQRLENKLEREQGELKLIAPDDSDANFEQLLAWKRDQLHRTGFFDILAVPETMRLLRLARDLGPNSELRGLMLTLTLNGTPVAGQFGVALGDHYHPWIAAYDPALAPFSPGLILISRAIHAMPALGLTRYELGVGHAQYKRIYANEARELYQGVAFGGGFHAVTERAGEHLGRSLERLPAPVAHAMRRLRRRADQIAAAERRPMQRVAALTDAFIKRSFRPSAAETAHGAAND
jgi:CelD/BcsL family acetyltransferase involved in cellulose biosynthesis